MVATGRAVLNGLIVVLVLAGLWTVGSFVLQLIWPIASSVHFDLAAAVTSGTAFVHQDGAIWLSALATIAVWWATRNLVRVTNAQFATNGPLLMVDLALATPADANVAPYYTNWSAEDSENDELRPFVASSPPNHLYLAIGNRKKEASAVAGDVAITVSLYFGSTTGHAPHPHFIRRTVRVETLDPFNYVVGPCLNTGSLDAYLAVVERVEYRDISDRRRSAGWGTNVIMKTPGASPIMGKRIFKPRKGEFSDGHR